MQENMGSELPGVSLSGQQRKVRIRLGEEIARLHSMPNLSPGQCAELARLKAEYANTFKR